MPDPFATPEPTDEEAAAIVAAVELAWPRRVEASPIDRPAPLALQRPLVVQARPGQARPPVLTDV